MYAITLVLLMLATFLAFQPGKATDFSEVVNAKAKVTAEQMLIEHQAAVNAAVAATPAAMGTGTIARTWLSPQEPTWFTAGARFTSATDGSTLVMTTFPGDSKLWQPMAATLSQEVTAVAAMDTATAVKSTMSGVIAQGATGPYLQVQPQQSAPVKVSLPSSVANGAAVGTPALLTVVQ
jgi:hypothetical protein